MKDIEQALSGVFKHAAAGNTAVLIFRIIVALILLWIFSRIIETVCRRITKKICAKTDVDPGAVSFIAIARSMAESSTYVFLCPEKESLSLN